MISKLLDEVAKQTKTGSDYATAKLLDVPETTVNGWRKFGKCPNEYATLKIAEALGRDYPTLRAEMLAAHAPQESERPKWSALAGKLRRCAVMVGLATFSTYLFTGGDSLSTERQKQSSRIWSRLIADGEPAKSSRQPLFILCQQLTHRSITTITAWCLTCWRITPAPLRGSLQTPAKLTEGN